MATNAAAVQWYWKIRAREARSEAIYRSLEMDALEINRHGERERDPPAQAVQQRTRSPAVQHRGLFGGDKPVTRFRWAECQQCGVLATPGQEADDESVWLARRDCYSVRAETSARAHCDHETRSVLQRNSHRRKIARAGQPDLETARRRCLPLARPKHQNCTDQQRRDGLHPPPTLRPPMRSLQKAGASTPPGFSVRRQFCVRSVVAPPNRSSSPVPHRSAPEAPPVTDKRPAPQPGACLSPRPREGVRPRRSLWRAENSTVTARPVFVCDLCTPTLGRTSPPRPCRPARVAPAKWHVRNGRMLDPSLVPPAA